ncbi:isoprenoid synthase domain-containing protein [Lipomyces arxii]|uniref:isoprenoid synthase domain-containing protein n=1 Tax=Lipomyces arxii TaxID=56418 RepID=UPI0034D011B9
MRAVGRVLGPYGRANRPLTRIRERAMLSITGGAACARSLHSSSSVKTSGSKSNSAKEENTSTAERLRASTNTVASVLNSVFSAPSKIADAAFGSSAARSGNTMSGSKAFKDPLSLVAAEMTNLTNNIRQLLGSAHPTLDSAAKYYVQTQGKHIRPLLVLLMSKAVLKVPKSDHVSERYNVDESISPMDILRDFNPAKVISTIATTVSKSQSSTFAESIVEPETGILPSQRRLAEITEMIHAASLLHDDVIDDAELRRGNLSGNSAFGNKMAILAGDFLLGRASVSLARLRNAEVTELISTVIANLVEGEVMQLKNTAPEDSVTGVATPATFDYYLDKTYLKTASLISKSCRSAAVLAGAREDFVEYAYQYGRNLGMAFQIVDDLLDYTVTETELGKPAGADLQLGLATAPALFAWKQYPELGPMIRRKFSQPGDVKKARQLVEISDGVEQTRLLAKEYSEKARKALEAFPDSSAKEALLDMTTTVLKRKA